MSHRLLEIMEVMLLMFMPIDCLVLFLFKRLSWIQMEY